MIGIASSRGAPLETGNERLNKLSGFFPRGVVLGTARIANSFFVTNEELRREFEGQTQVKLHGYTFTVASEPLGEPSEDIQIAIENDSWRSYVWELKDVTPFRSPIAICEIPRSSWINVEISEDRDKPTKDLTSFLKSNLS